MRQASVSNAKHAPAAYRVGMAELTIVGLRVVHEVARQGSFSAAAAVLGYTQSAVSRQVAAMEKVSEAVLFERLPRGVRPTRAGEVVVRRARRVLAEVDAVLQEVAGLRDRLAGRLVVAAFPTAAAVLAPRAIARLTTRHPNLDVDLLERASPAQIRLLRSGRVEVAIVATGGGMPDHDLSALRRLRVHIARGPGIAVPSGHRLVGHREIEIAELLEETWIVGAGSAEEPQFGAWPGLTDPRIGPSARTWATRFGLVAAGLGITYVPGLAADAVPEGVRWLPVRPTDTLPARELFILTAPDPSPNAQAAVHAILDSAAELTPP
jgi:DNA-binding transcriptional LysR family regulator